MDFIDLLLERNKSFAETQFVPELKMLPSTGTIVLGCVDPRVDPEQILGFKPGEAAIIRNVGGRVSKNVFETLGILRVVAQSRGRAGGIRNLVLLHHTDCGIIGCLHHAPDLLAKHMGIEADKLDTLEIEDPYKSVVLDAEILQANKDTPDDLVVSGLVYDVKTGKVDLLVPPTAVNRSSK